MSDIPPDDHDDDHPEEPGRPEILGTSIAEVLTYAWRKFTQSLGQWVVIWLAILGISVAVFAASLFISAGTTTSGDTDPQATFNLTGFVAAVIGGVVLGILLVVVARAAVMAVEGRPIDVGEAFRLTGPNLAAGAVFGGVYGIFNAALPLVGIVVFVVLGFMPVLSALDDRGADTIGDAVRTLRRQPRTSLPFWVIGWFLTGCLCAIGAPITMLGAVYLVKRYRDEPVAP